MKSSVVCAAALASLLCLGATASEAKASEYTKTQYPIVLAHGLLGFDSLIGIVDYWPGIVKALESDGGEVYVTEVSQLNDTALRGAQLLEQVEEIVAITGAEKVNLIGHSHGGLDSRWVAAMRPDLVASVTTVATPHQGAELADYLRETLDEGSWQETVFAGLVGGLGSLISLIAGTGYTQDPQAALASLTTEGMLAFNADFPLGLPTTPCGEGPAQVDDIYYFSWSGSRALTNALDLTDALFGLTSQVYGEENDGLVGRCSSHFGTVIRDDYKQNHIDVVNLMGGLVHWWSVKPKTLYRQHANRLKNLGL